MGTTGQTVRGQQRVFTVQEVDNLIPSLSSKVGDLLIARSEIERLVAELSEQLGYEPKSLALDSSDSGSVASMKQDLRQRMSRYEAGWSEIEAMGAFVKDPRIGLLDFYGNIEGRLVWLCWRYGEDSLGYYHELNAGYAGRRTLGRRERALLLN
ncbi:MAG: DUF2203 domain-containing protein [Polyangiaceae bacterium]|nr:DUF2203 domain-containing protein [Myxococcales bacterium]MCB9585188.1 DUF2203 domain-containing protein [Polyangiaceae bacterium]